MFKSRLLRVNLVLVAGALAGVRFDTLESVVLGVAVAVALR